MLKYSFSAYKPSAAAGVAWESPSTHSSSQAHLAAWEDAGRGESVHISGLGPEGRDPELGQHI